MGNRVSHVEAPGLAQNTHSNVGCNVHYLCLISINPHNDSKGELLLLCYLLLLKILKINKPRFKEMKLLIQGNTPNMQQNQDSDPGPMDTNSEKVLALLKNYSAKSLV